jgi:hypothetical protein
VATPHIWFYALNCPPPPPAICISSKPQCPEMYAFPHASTTPTQSHTLSQVAAARDAIQQGVRRGQRFPQRLFVTFCQVPLQCTGACSPPPLTAPGNFVSNRNTPHPPPKHVPRLICLVQMTTATALCISQVLHAAAHHEPALTLARSDPRRWGAAYGRHPASHFCRSIRRPYTANTSLILFRARCECRQR